MIYALNKKLQKLIRRRNAGKPAGMKIIPHANFLYGKDVLNWAGKAAAWLFPKIGCVPVQNRGNNRKGLQILREHMRTGTFPIALAPESQVTYHMYTCSDISAGVSSLAAWGEESTKDVTIIPVAIGYRHFKAPDAGIRSVLARWEKQTGMQLRDLESSPVLMLLQEATDKTLSLLEELYNISPPSSQNQRERILIICETALQRAEHLAQQAPEGDLLDRLFRIRYCGVDAIYPESFDPKALPPLGRSIADFHALEAHVYVRHSQIVDVLQYLDPAYIAAPCSAGRACEYALNLLDVIQRAEGGNINTRYSPKRKRAMVDIGKPIRLSQLGEAGDSGSRKERLRHITHQVQRELQTVSEEMEQHWEVDSPFSV